MEQEAFINGVRRIRHPHPATGDVFNMADHQSAAMIVIIQIAWWCGLGTKWLLLTRCGQKPVRKEAASEAPHCTGGFTATADEAKNQLPECNDMRQQEHGGLRRHESSYAG
jgi:hypothetical protein